MNDPQAEAYARLHAEDVLRTFDNETMGSGRYIATELGAALRQLLATSRESTGYASDDKDLKIAKLEAELKALKTPENPKEAPDDSDHDEEIRGAADFTEALWAIAEKYDIPLTNNEPRWQNGEYLRSIGDFISDVKTAAERYS